MIKKFNALRSSFEVLGVDAIYLTSSVSHRYFTGFENPDGAILITQDEIFAFEDFRYTEIANELLGSFCKVIAPQKSFKDELIDVINDKKLIRIGYEDLSMSVADFKRLCTNFNAELIEIGDTVSKMREIKDEREICSIREAQRITDLAFEHILKIISPEMTECDVALELEYFMRKNGASDKSFDTIAISGEKSSMPHGVPENTKLKKGFLTMDFGCVVDGYHSDMTRTVCLGKATSEMKKLYDTVLSAQTNALEFLKAGIKCSDADKTARDIIYRDYKGCFGHSLGHSVGLEIHETPSLSPRCDKILVCGNVVTVEPGIYIPKFGGVRIEDLVVIRKDKIENLTHSPKNLIEIY
ncbi:MAG: aminopeptidase P family protein [Clostridia bacterium]|nr:aminopeptidase P family protein [Clostridia bacterium]